MRDDENRLPCENLKKWKKKQKTKKKEILEKETKKSRTRINGNMQKKK